MANTIIRASAGSGKTFQLSNQYLDIIFRRPPDEAVKNVGTILASTFTRKAAGEILDRILQRLADAALDEKKREELMKRLDEFSNFTGLPKPDYRLTEKSLLEYVAKLARNLYRLRISTLDSFFNKIASTFALELALPPGWEIVDEADAERFITEAIRNVFDKSERNQAKKLMNLLQKGDQDRNVLQELSDLTSNLLPVIRKSSPEAWEHETPDRLGNLVTGLLNTEELPELLDQLRNDEILPVTATKKNSKPNGHFVNARNSFVKLVIQEQWEEILGHGKNGKKNEGLGNQVITGKNTYYNKEIEGELYRLVYRLTTHARAVWIKTTIDQTRATGQLLRYVFKSLDEILTRERCFRFDDITYRLGQTDFMQPPEASAHRMDAKTDHLLLDEFQDTSLIQWNVLEPFAKGVDKCNGKTFFCVGDVKQAIYAWRGGVAEIFETINETIKEDGADVREVSMDQTRRNSQPVIDAVNKVFLTITQNNAVTKKSPKAAEKWENLFKEHLTFNKNAGYCVLESVPVEENKADNDSDRNSDNDSDEEINETDPFLTYTLDRIENLYNNRRGKSIGVLVRTKKNIAPLIAGLRCRGIEVSEEGGNPLTDSAAVQHILSAMTLADHPGDKIAKFHLSCGKLADESSSQIRGDLVNDGYGLTVERLAKKLTASCNQREFQRLQKLTELAHRFDKTAKGVRTKRFIKIVQTTRVESPTGDDIRVMTIHKSKGLEFDVVVLPELDLHLSDSQPKILVARKTPMSPIDFVLRYVEKNLQPLLPEKYQQAFDVRMQGHIEESLSLLYVAMTRARSELVMMIPEKSRKGLSTFAGVLRCALAEQSKEQAAEQTTPQATPQPKILFETGTKNWFTPTKIKIKTEKQPVIQLDCELPPDKLYRHLPRTSASSLELDLFTVGEPETSNAATTDSVTTTFPKRNQDDALLRGIAMHACFEHGLQKNPWLDESKPDSNFLKQVIETAVLGKRGKIDSQEIVAQFLEACGKPNLRKVLSRSNYVAETVDVEHERRFAVRFDDELLHGYIDRLVIFRKSGKVVGLEIIDYKTGHFDVNRNEADFLAERQKVYAPQLKTYRKGMSRLYRIDPQTIKTTLLFVDIDRVVTID